MGGHDVERGACAYREIANLARELARSGFLVVSGGGPGLMEAANLGAYFGAQEDPSTLNGAIDKLSKAPLYSHADWLKLAWEIKAEYPSLDLKKSRSLGVPTWFYGFEPPNIFATHIAKYFENSLREEGLLAMASHGVVFAEGNAGTVQEIFQDGCQSYYESYGFKSPMILLDSGYWNPKPDKQGNYSDRKKPVWPLLRKLAQEKGFAELLELTDDTVTILKRIQSFRP